MKAFAMLALTAMTSCVFAYQDCPQTLRVVALEKVTDRILSGMLLGYYPDIAIEIVSGTPLPLYLLFEGDQGDLFTDKIEEGEMCAEEPFYVRCKQGKPLFSSDLVEWATFKDFFTGELDVKWNVLEGKSSLVVCAELHRRSKESLEENVLDSD